MSRVLMIPMDEQRDDEAGMIRFEREMEKLLPGVPFLLVYGMRGNATWVHIDDE